MLNVLVVLFVFGCLYCGVRYGYREEAPSGIVATLHALCPNLVVESAAEQSLFIRSAAEEAGARFFIDPKLLLSVIAAESRCIAKARSRAGALGLMQLMPATARELGVGDPHLIRDNVFGGAKYLAKLQKRFGSLELALAAYNAGPTKVRRYKGVPPYPETRKYVARVMDFYKQFGGERGRRADSEVRADEV